MPEGTVPNPRQPEVTGESLLRILDGLSSILLDLNDTVVGDPDVRMACAGLAEQVTQQLRADGWRLALRSRDVIADLAAKRCRR